MKTIVNRFVDDWNCGVFVKQLMEALMMRLMDKKMVLMNQLMADGIR
jgi:hypothetical protein